jgi:hypothetical protein
LRVWGNRGLFWEGEEEAIYHLCAGSCRVLLFFSVFHFHLESLWSICLVAFWTVY